MDQAQVKRQYAAVVVSLPARAEETGWEDQTVWDWNAELETIQRLPPENELFCEMNINMNIGSELVYQI